MGGYRHFLITGGRAMEGVLSYVAAYERSVVHPDLSRHLGLQTPWVCVADGAGFALRTVRLEWFHAGGRVRYVFNSPVGGDGAAILPPAEHSELSEAAYLRLQTAGTAMQ